MRYQLRVNPITCDGHGMCAELLPELIRLDRWGYPVLLSKTVPRKLADHARRAVESCPTLALLMEEANGLHTPEGSAQQGRVRRPALPAPAYPQGGAENRPARPGPRALE